MNFKDWKKHRAELSARHEETSRADAAAFKALLDSEIQVMVTLPTGTRLVISRVGDDGPMNATMARGHFLGLGEISIADLEHYLEIRRAIAAWKAGELEDLPLPKREFGPWGGP